MSKKVLIYTGKILGDNLVAIRNRMDMSQTDVSQKIGKTTMQVWRYENSIHNMSIDTLLQLCISLQVDPCELLGLKWVDESELGVVSSFRVRKDHLSIEWDCPNCKTMNISYGDWNKEDGELDVDSLSHLELMCEYCNSFFNSLRIKRKE